MDGKNDKKKESIDEILSDLNGLLNKMPSILDGIKMPEMQPLEPAKPAPAPEPRPDKPKADENIPAAGDEGDKTVVLQPFSGLSEGAEVPLETPAEPTPVPAGPDDMDKTVVLEPFSGLPEGSEAPELNVSAQAPVTEEEKPVVVENFPAPAEGAPSAEQEKLVPQSLGDFMFGAEAEAEAKDETRPAPAMEVVPEVPAEPASVPPSTEEAGGAPVPAADEAPAPEASLSGSASEELIFDSGATDPFGDGENRSEKGTGSRAYDTTKDFGVPDIDSLMQISAGENARAEEPAQPLPEEAIVPGPIPSEGGQKEELSFPDLAGIEEQLIADAPQGGMMGPDEPKEEKTGITPPGTEAPSAGTPEPVIEQEVKPEASFEAFTIEPSSGDSVPAVDAGEPFAPEQPAGPGAVSSGEQQSPFLEPAAADTEAVPGTQLPAAEAPAASPGLEVVQPIQFGSGDETPAAPGLELAPGINLSVGIPASSANPEETLPGGPGVELGGPASQPPSGDETLVVAPQAAPSGEEEKTVIFQVNPDTTTRAQAKDLASLSSKNVPQGIPEDRIRVVAFLYSPGDEALCATVLAELDAICLKSAAKPMFIKRAYVQVCDIDSNSNFVHQSVQDAGAVGLVCVGAIPPEKLYEIENVFSSSGGFFRHYDSSTFGHSSALDLVADLIVR